MSKEQNPPFGLVALHRRRPRPTSMTSASKTEAAGRPHRSTTPPEHAAAGSPARALQPPLLPSSLRHSPSPGRGPCAAQRACATPPRAAASTPSLVALHRLAPVTTLSGPGSGGPQLALPLWTGATGAWLGLLGARSLDSTAQAEGWQGAWLGRQALARHGHEPHSIAALTLGGEALPDVPHTDLHASTQRLPAEGGWMFWMNRRGTCAGAAVHLATQQGHLFFPLSCS